MIKIRNYTEEQIKYVADHYHTMDANDIAKHIGKTRNNVYFVGRKLGFEKQIHNSWTNDEIIFLKEHYIDMTSEEISKHISHSISAINTQKDRLNLVRNDSWDNKDIKFLQDNYINMTYKEIGKILNRTESAVRAKCFDLDLYKKESPWTEEEIAFVKNNYMEMPINDIAKILDRTYNAVELKASKMGMKKSPYTCDYHYFDDINTEEKAYWLGFLTADGWINKSKTTNAGVTGIELQYEDLKHLKKFNKSIKGNYQITDRWRTCTLSTKDKDKKYHTCIIRIFSMVMYESLYNIGFTNDKTYDCKIPNIKENLFRHFLRGYFDGDGCFTLTNKSFHLDFLTASNNIFEDLKKVLSSINISFTENGYITEFDTKMYTIQINKNKDKLKLLDYMYKNCNLYLDRKYKKYLKAKTRFETNKHESLAS